MTNHSSRRQFFQMLLSATSLAAADRDKQNMIVRSVRPEDLEMPLDGFATWITPVERFFVRSHMYVPTVEAASWKLNVGGEVATPLTLAMEDLRKMPAVEVVSVLECAGNGRSFYEPTITGMQWKYGSVGNGRWRGVRLGDVLKKAGLKAGAKEILFNGADVPIGTMPDFTRTVPVKKALSPETLLAYEMNGEQLPVKHGFPLRAVVPGWAGDSWVKWVTDITVLDKDHDGFFMKTAYRYPVEPIAPGTALDPAQMRPLESIRPKSVIAGPVNGARIAKGPVRIFGAAWSGDAAIARVEVSTDSGRTWKPATLGRDQSRYAWRLFEMNWTPPRNGSHVIMSRATDASGNTQPLVQDWNPSGYQHNVVQHVRIDAGPGPEPAAAAPPPIPEFPAKVKQSCIGCHEADIIAGQRLTRGQWDREIDKMVRWGSAVKPEDRGALLDFLSQHFPVR